MRRDQRWFNILRGPGRLKQDPWSCASADVQIKTNNAGAPGMNTKHVRILLITTQLLGPRAYLCVLISQIKQTVLHTRAKVVLGLTYGYLRGCTANVHREKSPQNTPRSVYLPTSSRCQSHSGTCCIVNLVVLSGTYPRAFFPTSRDRPPPPHHYIMSWAGGRSTMLSVWDLSLRVVIGYDPWGAYVGYYPRASFNVILYTRGTSTTPYVLRTEFLDTLFSHTISNTCDTACVFRMCYVTAAKYSVHTLLRITNRIKRSRMVGLYCSWGGGLAFLLLLLLLTSTAHSFLWGGSTSSSQGPALSILLPEESMHILCKKRALHTS